VRHLLVTAYVVPSSPIVVTVMMEALSSSEMSILTRATRRNIPEDAIIQHELPTVQVFKHTSNSFFTISAEYKKNTPNVVKYIPLKAGCYTGQEILQFANIPKVIFH
jgi:hypothetical protein